MKFGGDMALWQRRVAESPEGAIRRSAVFEVLAPRAQSHVLDVGCGGGHLLRDLALAVAPDGRAVGVDISDDQLAAARERCADAPCAELTNADVGELPWEDGTFDGVCSLQTLEYVGDVDRALSEIRRVMKRGGRVALISLLWDAFRFHGPEPGLNEQIIDAWRAHCPHQMLPTEMSRRMASAGLGGVLQRPIAFYNGALHENAYAYWACKIVAAFAVTQGVSEVDAQAWLDQLAQADRDGRFGFVSVPVLTIGTAV